MSTIEHLVCETPIKLLAEVDIEPDFDQCSFKNIELRRAPLNEYCAHVVNRMASFIREDRLYQYVFIKNQEITEPIPAGRWHLDSSLNPIHEYENFLFVIGEARTQFVTTRTWIRHASSAQDFHKQMAEKWVHTVTVPNATIVGYSGSAVHRTPSLMPGRRLLIRLSSTDRKLTKYEPKRISVSVPI